jgi:hypothetical protein
MIIYTDILKELYLIIGYTILAYWCNYVFVYPDQKGFLKSKHFLSIHHYYITIITSVTMVTPI